MREAHQPLQLARGSDRDKVHRPLLSWHKVFWGEMFCSSAISQGRCHSYVGHCYWEAKHLERTCQEFKEYQKENGDTGSMPSYSHPSLTPDAVSQGYRQPEWAWRPYGNVGGVPCGRCGSQGCNGKDKCPRHADSLRNPITTRECARVPRCKEE